MNYIEEIGNFYNSLTTIGLVIFWISIFFFFFLLFLVVILYKKNKKLKSLLKEKNTKIEKEENTKNKKGQNNKLSSDDIPLKIFELKEDNFRKIPDPITKNPEKKEEKNFKGDKTLKEQIKVVAETTSFKEKEQKLYQKNVLKNIKAPTSPININNQNPSIKELKMNLNDFIKKERKNGNNIKVVKNNNYSNDTNKNTSNYMEEVSKRLATAQDNSPIELTDYEKKQEEEAIISYKELIKNKDKIYQISDDEADIEFINELKNFRESLKEKNTPK